MIENILDPLLKLGPFWSIFIIVFILNLFTNIIYKYATDQKLMKSIKEQQKKHQAEMKKCKDNPDKLMKIQKKTMSLSGDMMKQSMKPMLFTIIPFILVFGWMNTHFVYLPITPQADFTVTALFVDGAEGEMSIASITPENQVSVSDQSIKQISDNIVSWKLNGPRGEYILEYEYKDKKYTQELLIDELYYKEPVKIIDDPELKQVIINNEKNYPFNIFGLKFNWFWTYFVLYLVLNIITRKIMKIH